MDTSYKKVYDDYGQVYLIIQKDFSDRHYHVRSKHANEEDADLILEALVARES